MKGFIFNNGQSLASRMTSMVDPRITVRYRGEEPQFDSIPAAAFGMAKGMIDAGYFTEIEILTSAVGGQEIDRYIVADADPSQWDRLSNVYVEAGSPSIAAEVFIQGEADWQEPTAETYIAKRKTMRGQLENLTGQDDFLSFSSVPFSGVGATVRAIRGDAFRMMPVVCPWAVVVETGDLSADDSVHINEAGLVEIGRRMSMSYPDNRKFLASPAPNRCCQVRDGEAVELSLPYPQSVTVEVKGGGTISLPAAGPSSGSIVTLFAQDGCDVVERKDVNGQGLGFYSYSGGSIDVLPRGVYTLSAAPIMRRWVIVKID
jgi:hypothetical protein